MKRTEALALVDRAMVRIRRSQSRRSIGKLMQQKLGSSINLADIAVVDALQELADAGEEQPTIGNMAEKLGIEPSRASRMTTGALRAGLVKRIASQADGRRSHLAITPKGLKALETIQKFRIMVFSQLMSEWSDRNCEQFAELLIRFTDSLVEVFASRKQPHR
jgi:DNA-binding MarR family transcriptional regulator